MNLDGQLLRGKRDNRTELDDPGLDNLCFAFLFPQRLGRFPKSIVLDKLFLLSPAEGEGWD